MVHKMDQPTREHCCDLCGSTHKTLLYDKGRHGASVMNYVCEDCGFVYILPRLTESDVEDLYKQGDFAQEARGARLPGVAKYAQCEVQAARRVELLEKFLAKQGNGLYRPQGRSVLEVGCGTGSFLFLLQATGWDVQGLEPDEAYGQAAAEYYNIPISPALLEEYSDGRLYDLTCSFQVIEHVTDPAAFLCEQRKRMKPDGLMFIDCPSLERMLDDPDHFFWDVHINSFTPQTLSGFLEKSGFEPLEVGHHGASLYAIARAGEAKTEAFKRDNADRIRTLLKQEQNKKQRKAMKKTLAYRCLRKARRIVTLTGFREKRKYRQTIERTGIPAQRLAISPVANANRTTPPLRMAHVGLHGNGNAGDSLLFPAVRELFQQQVAPTEFQLLPLHGPVTQETINGINERDALIIGGGGLFIEDSNPNALSGWQWPISRELLDKIQVPIVLFAVGYNFFRGQAEPSAVFKENVAALIEKAAFVGLRNHGSIDALRSMLPSHLHEKIVYQPCPTTVLREYYPGLLPLEPATDRTKTLALNVAFDRIGLRLGKDINRKCWELADAMKEIRGKGWDVKLFAHMWIDANARFWMQAREANLEVVNLGGVSPKIVVDAYARADLSVGMRGHAQMVPFGVGNPIYSLISHDKLRYFLDDIEHPEWGVDMREEAFGKQLLAFVNDFDLDSQRQQVAIARERLWQLTLENTKKIRSMLQVAR